MPTLSSLVALVVVMTIDGAVSDDKVGIMTTLLVFTKRRIITTIVLPVTTNSASWQLLAVADPYGFFTHALHGYFTWRH